MWKIIGLLNIFRIPGRDKFILWSIILQTFQANGFLFRKYLIPVHIRIKPVFINDHLKDFETFMHCPCIAYLPFYVITLN